MSLETAEKVAKLQQILKVSLEECIALARKKIRSKKGLTDLQSLLVDYHEDTELASIILEVIRLISSYETVKKDEADELRETVPLQEYNNLEICLQKHESSVREHIRIEQQLKIYCDQLEQKNKEMETNNEELLKSTKLMITNLKRENQKLIEENHTLQVRIKEREGRDSREGKDSSVKDKEQSLINSIKKARKMIDSHNSITHREESATANWQDKSEEFLKGRRSSLSSIRAHK